MKIIINGVLPSETWDAKMKNSAKEIIFVMKHLIHVM
jgi:hypothetical protein